MKTTQRPIIQMFYYPTIILYYYLILYHILILFLNIFLYYIAFVIKKRIEIV